MKTSEVGINLIKKYEGFYDSPYLCPAGIFTIGYGHCILDNGKQLRKEDEHKARELMPYISEERASSLLADDLLKYESIVNKRLKVALKQNQFDALVSHTYNTGGSDTLFQLINDGKDVKEWWTTKYITANGVVLNGLKKRRLEEYNLYAL